MDVGYRSRARCHLSLIRMMACRLISVLGPAGFEGIGMHCDAVLRREGAPQGQW